MNHLIMIYNYMVAVVGPQWSRSTRKVLEEYQLQHKYWDMGDKLMSDNGLLLQGSRIVIHPVLRKSFLHQLHEQHTGITQCSTQPEHWSPGLESTTYTEDCVKWCPTCIMLSSTLPVEPLINHSIPKGPWQKLVQILWIGTAKSTYSSIISSSIPSFSKCPLPLLMLSLAA